MSLRFHPMISSCPARRSCPEVSVEEGHDPRLGIRSRRFVEAHARQGHHHGHGEGQVAAVVVVQERVTGGGVLLHRSEEHTSELQSLMRISYAVFCLKKKTITPKLPIQTIDSSSIRPN